jgi:hypothetical protein
MTDSERDPGVSDRINRRTVLKGTAAGLVGVGLAGTASADQWREIKFCATSSETFRYSIAVDGDVKRGDGSDRWDEVGDNSIEGAVSKNRCDNFFIKGKIVDSELSGPGKVLVDGRVVEDLPTSDGGDDGDGQQRYKQVRFKSVSDEIFRYRVSVSGRLKREPNRDGFDTQIDENSAKGASRGGQWDDWRFTGEVTELELSGPGKVLIDGQVVEDTTKDDGEQFPQEVIIDSPGDDTLRDYVFFVRGANARLKKLEPNEDSGPAVDDVRRLDNGDIRVDGTVGSGDDRFAFNGTFEEGDPFPSKVRARISDR